LKHPGIEEGVVLSFPAPWASTLTARILHREWVASVTVPPLPVFYKAAVSSASLFQIIETSSRSQERT